jgi:signal transduction histidine kinase
VKTFSIRYLLGVITLIILISAAVAGAAGSPTPDPRQFLPVLDTLQADMIRHQMDWHNATWQESLREQLIRQQVDAVIQDANGAEIFRTGTSIPLVPYRRVVLVEGGQVIGTLSLYIAQLEGDQWLNSVAPLLLIANQIALFITLSWLVKRYLTDPLAAIGKAARQIANHDLNFTLPSTRVREIADVALAFEVMRKGLQDALEQQNHMEQERRFFISAIAHDLRTPLFSLRGYLEGLTIGIASTPEKMGHYLSMCRLKAEALEQLIADLFTFARLDYLEQVPQYELVELSTLVKQAMEGIRPLAEKKSIALRMDGTGTPVTVQADKQLLLRMMENLLSNSIRHTPAHGCIDISYAVLIDQVRLCVSDNGPGISPQDLPYVFEPLYRGETSRSAATGGSGLGLAIAQRVMRAHHGELSAVNRPSGGAQFTARFPNTMPFDPRPAPSEDSLA